LNGHFSSEGTKSVVFFFLPRGSSSHIGCRSLWHASTRTKFGASNESGIATAYISL
jgi:hypothetical protein